MKVFPPIKGIVDSKSASLSNRISKSERLPPRIHFSFFHSSHFIPRDLIFSPRVSPPRQAASLFARLATPLKFFHVKCYHNASQPSRHLTRSENFKQSQQSRHYPRHHPRIVPPNATHPTQAFIPTPPFIASFPRPA